ncbi:XRE family transcriptional regulator [Rhizobium flavescens]|uniref:XRE family transcriptional regulator n=1 Tax=Rhizobium flavescens TaxID=2607407 RepID=UPI00140CBC6B|nr:XRE family transcriptional regulator [Rhizobium flavescens]
MTTLLFADALRVARTLAGLSQREAAARIAITQKAVWIAENTDELGRSTNIRLRALYEALGIEFLGTIDFASGRTSGLGARWRVPAELPEHAQRASEFRTERTGVAFAAARSLLNKKQSEIAGLLNMAERKIGQLEAGGSTDQQSSHRLRSFYEREGIAFLGWGDVTSGLFYGVGVRWRDEP